MKIKRFFATTFSITLLLLLGGVAAYLMLGAREKANMLSSEFMVSIYLRDSISATNKLQIDNNLQQIKDIRDISFVNKQQAAADFSKQLGMDFVTLFDTNPLPASYQVSLKYGTNVRDFQHKVSSWNGVEEVTYPYQLADEVNNGLAQLGYFVIAFSVILSIVLIIVLHNTVRMDVAASGDDVARAVHQRMPIKLIRTPFLLRAYSQGALAGAIASVFLFLATDGIALTMPIAKLPVDLPLLLLIFAIMTLAGMLLTTLFTYTSINTQIRNSIKNR